MRTITSPHVALFPSAGMGHLIPFLRIAAILASHNSGVAPVAVELNIPNYAVITTSARFFSFLAYLPTLTSEPSTYFNGGSDNVKIPGLTPLPKSSILLPFNDPNDLCTEMAVSNARTISTAKGVLANTFDWLEAETLVSLNSGKVINNLPLAIPIGPLAPCEFDNCQTVKWLDEQPAKSVVVRRCA
ncbi:hypothetical protein RJ641_006732 [Dillenia turbinata]|uniref:Uncharacterized protein n=1 Tax=Dillenia turbinata TaxID=194707 RepID=A0AAN8Z7V1_9MAGN